MAGTLFGLPLSQQLDENGNPQSGALLYVYAALTSTPSDTFADSGLATLNSFPLVCDASGRIPQFWVDDGSYRARLTTAAGVEIFDEDSILALGPSVASSGGSGGGGGSGGTTDSATIFTTGDMKWKPIAGTETGWVRCNGRTIGSQNSSASELPSATTADLYAFLWNNFNNTLCPVSTGRGSGPTTDFALDKTIGTLDMRGYGTYGLDGMGNSLASRLSGVNADVATSSRGAETTTIAQANLPSYNLSTASLTGSVGTTISNGTLIARNVNTNTNLTGGGGGNYLQSASSATLALSDGTVTFGGTIPSGGSGTAATTISPGRLGTWLMKL